MRSKELVGGGAPQGSEDDDLLTYDQAAKELNWLKTTLYSKVSRCEVPHFRIGRRFVRFSRRALRQWLAERAVEPSASPPRPLAKR